MPHPRSLYALPKAVAAWGTPDFSSTLKAELESLGGEALPLDQGVSQGGYVDDGTITALVLRFADVGKFIEAKAGIFFTEVVGGYGCPIEPIEHNVYCALEIRIDKHTATAEVWFVQAD